jgi:hypothetical protein
MYIIGIKGMTRKKLGTKVLVTVTPQTTAVGLEVLPRYKTIKYGHKSK